MQIKPVIQSQYHAALAMMRQAIEKCPQCAVSRYQIHSNVLWHGAFHMLFHTHFYLHPSINDLVPWEKRQDNMTSLEATSGEGQIYTKEDMLAVLSLCLHFMEEKLEEMDLAAESGFY